MEEVLEKGEERDGRFLLEQETFEEEEVRRKRFWRFEI
jgi:hypothetical protein